MTNTQNIVSLASDITDNDRHKLKICRVAVVHDEIESKDLIAFIHAVYPKLTEITLIHSAANKVLPEVNETIAIAKTYGITMHHVMVSSLPELYTAANALASDTQGIFILKDSLIVSGISTLAKVAAARHIPLITSDQGSVQDGAAFAVGVHEREIGVQGAILSAAILQGKSPCDLPIVSMKKLTVFINKKSLQEENQPINVVLDAAKQFAYQPEIVDKVGV